MVETTTQQIFQHRGSTELVGVQSSAINRKKRILVTGASGFIGHHLVNYLKKQGHFVRGVDWEPIKYEYLGDEFDLMDLRSLPNCFETLRPLKGAPIDEVYALAADMGGIGFISVPENQQRIIRNNLMINLHTVHAAQIMGVKKYLYTSSACVYPTFKQTETNIKPLKESDAHPAQPEDTYGWEKLITEILVNTYSNDMDIRVVRFHNIYGPEGEYDGGREKAPAAICRKIAIAKLNGDDSIDIWGDGKQTRSFCYIDDCLKGLQLVMDGEYNQPVNLGRDDMISIKELADYAQISAETKLKYNYIKGWTGVRGRNSDNSLFRKLYGWEPEIDMQTGLDITYKWIEGKIGA